MAAFTKTVTPSLATKLPCNAHRIGPLISSDAIAAGDACNIASDGSVVRASGAAANALANVDGFAMLPAASGRPVTLYTGVDVSYGPATAVPGTRLYLSGSVAGGLDTATSTGGTVAVASVVEIATGTNPPHAILRVTRNP
jgi:hypothetical protein